MTIMQGIQQRKPGLERQFKVQWLYQLKRFEAQGVRRKAQGDNEFSHIVFALCLEPFSLVVDSLLKL